MQHQRSEESRGKAHHLDGDHAATERAAAAAHATVDRVAARAAGVERELRSTARAAGAKAEGARHEIARESKRAWGAMERIARQQPITSAALAFTAGVITTSLWRRH